MIPKEKLPSRNFTADELVDQGHDRNDVLSTMKYLEGKGEGVYIVGRRGGATRFEWNKENLKPASPQKDEYLQGILNGKSSIPEPVIIEEKDHMVPLLSTDRSKEVLRAFANLTAFKGEPTFEALQAHINNKMKELEQLQKSVVVSEPPGIEHVPYDWISEKTLDNNLQQIGWSFWTPEQREAIAKELRAWRGNK